MEQAARKSQQNFSGGAKMKKLIDRYVYDVVRRLPETERMDVQKELTSSIYDMLPDEPNADEVESALNELGAPYLLAEKYRQHPKYLISPAVYESYIGTLKWLLPFVGLLLFIVGIIKGGLESFDAGSDAIQSTANLIAGGISGGLSGTLQCFFWMTLVYAIIDRVSKKSPKNGAAWQTSYLPDDVPPFAGLIHLSEIFVEFMLMTGCTVVLLLVCTGTIPVVFSLTTANIAVISPFSKEFLQKTVPFIIIVGLSNTGEYVLKIVYRRWNIQICGAVILSNLLMLIFAIVLFGDGNVFSAEFLSLCDGKGWDFVRNTAIPENPVLSVFLTLFCVFSMADCVNAVSNTLKARKAA